MAADMKEASVATVNPIQVQKFLGGLEYPASKEELVDHADESGADEQVLGALRQIPDRSYDGPNAVSQELGRLEG